MDKLRALHYFVAAAEEGSFSAAARRFDVSVPAVTKLVSSLERDLGVKLLDRSTQGLTLTARGAQYLESCAPLLAQLADADRMLAAHLDARLPEAHARGRRQACGPARADSHKRESLLQLLRKAG